MTPPPITGWAVVWPDGRTVVEGQHTMTDNTSPVVAIEQAIVSICSDANADAASVARDVIAALKRSGYVIVENGNAHGERNPRDAHSNDLVARLCHHEQHSRMQCTCSPRLANCAACDCGEAADEITRLRAQLAKADAVVCALLDGDPMKPEMYAALESAVDRHRAASGMRDV